ncbi:SDR family NAD(P)-dependent oxidoreductase [Solibacillus silvestris]
MRLNRKVAIVTGSSNGIGEASALLMAKNGAKVVVADLDFDGATRVAQTIKNEGGEAIAFHLNALEEESIKSMIDMAKETYGKIDILYNNVGGTSNKDKGSRVADLDAAAWDFALNLSLKSVAFGCQYVIPHMIENGGGVIVNTASMAGTHGDLQASAYGAAKAGVISLTKYIATQYGKQGIRCNSIAPGLIITADKEASFNPQLKEIFLQHNAVNYHGRPEDIANAAIFLASDESRFMTGQTLIVDGGSGIHASTFADFMKMSNSSY